MLMPTINEILLSNPRILYTGNQNFTDTRTVVGVYVQLTGRYSNNLEERHPITKGNLSIQGSNLQSGGFYFGN
jgi:hypothetical protein